LFRKTCSSVRCPEGYIPHPFPPPVSRLKEIPRLSGASSKPSQVLRSRDGVLLVSEFLLVFKKKKFLFPSLLLYCSLSRSPFPCTLLTCLFTKPSISYMLCMLCHDYTSGGFQLTSPRCNASNQLLVIDSQPHERKYSRDWLSYAARTSGKPWGSSKESPQFGQRNTQFG